MTRNACVDLDGQCCPPLFSTLIMQTGTTLSTHNWRCLSVNGSGQPSQWRGKPLDYIVAGSDVWLVNSKRLWNLSFLNDSVIGKLFSNYRLTSFWRGNAMRNGFSFIIALKKYFRLNNNYFLFAHSLRIFEEFGARFSYCKMHFINFRCSIINVYSRAKRINRSEFIIVRVSCFQVERYTRTFSEHYILTESRIRSLQHTHDVFFYFFFSY